MCKKQRVGNDLLSGRTLGGIGAHCRAGEKTQGEQHTDRAAHWALLSCLWSVVWRRSLRLPAEYALLHASPRQNAISTNAADLQRRCVRICRKIAFVARQPRIIGCQKARRSVVAVRLAGGALAE